MGWTILTLLILLAAVACVVFLLLRSKARGVDKSKDSHTLSSLPSATTRGARPVPKQRPPEPQPVLSQAVAGDENYNMRRLVNLVYDQQRAERLVAFEQDKNPGKSRLWCINRAIERLLRDRHAR